jgi:two-component system sensor histidine kinase KdpD
MSRLEAGALRLTKGNYHISEILDSVSSRLASLTEHHRLEVIVPSGLSPVFVDEMRIGQVPANLVENATKYSPEGSEITVEAQLDEDQITVSVTDRGEGIAPELLDRVFDRFYQAESIVTGRKSGTGLGLSICRGIIEAHGGRIWVESKLREGSKFSFSLPMGRREDEVAEGSGH